MTASETKFRNLLMKRYPGAYIWKVADYKQTGNALNRGMPDYYVAHDGQQMWFEVKLVKSNKRFNFKELRDAQLIEFKHMLDAQIDVNIAIYTYTWDLMIVPFSRIYEAYLKGDKFFELSFIKP